MTTWTADVAILGAGPAGAAAALDLAQAGFDVLLMDRHDFPRLKPCAGGVTIKAAKRLRYDISPVVRERATVLQMSLYQKRRTDFVGPSDVVLMTHRPELDTLAVDQAVASGARFQRIAALHAVIQSSEGVTLHCGAQTVQAQWLIAADGANSPTRRLLFGNPGVPGAIAIEGLLPRAQCREYPLTGFDFGVLPCGYGWVFPKHDHVNVGLYVARQGKAMPDRKSLAAYALVRMGSDQLTDIQGFPIGTQGHRWPISCGRVLFAGDAAGFAEPLLGEGIYGAILAGQYAAEAIISDGPVTEIYQQLVYGWCHELGSVHRLSRLFYGALPLAFGVLKHGVRKPLMQGFADGLTLGQCKRRMLAPS